MLGGRKSRQARDESLLEWVGLHYDNEYVWTTIICFDAIDGWDMHHEEQITAFGDSEEHKLKTTWYKYKIAKQIRKLALLEEKINDNDIDLLKYMVEKVNMALDINVVNIDDGKIETRIL